MSYGSAAHALRISASGQRKFSSSGDKVEQNCKHLQRDSATRRNVQRKHTKYSELWTSVWKSLGRVLRRYVHNRHRWRHDVPELLDRSLQSDLLKLYYSCEDHHRARMRIFSACGPGQRRASGKDSVDDTFWLPNSLHFLREVYTPHESVYWHNLEELQKSCPLSRE